MFKGLLAITAIEKDPAYTMAAAMIIMSVV